MVLFLLIGTLPVNGETKITSKIDAARITCPKPYSDRLTKTFLNKEKPIHRSLKRASEIDVPAIYTKASLDSYAEDAGYYTEFTSKGASADFTFTAEVNGSVIVYIAASNENTGQCEVLWSDSAHTKSNVTYLSPGDITGFTIFSVYAGETCTLHLSDISNTTSNDAYAFIPFLTESSSGRTFASSYASDNYPIASGIDATTYWKKITNKKGRFSIWACDGFYDSPVPVAITLYNSKKKAVSKTISLNDQTAYFGALGDSTYYVKVETDSPFYGIKCSTYGYGYSPATSKSKAKTISSGSTKYSTLSATTSSVSHWYKMKLSKKRRIRVSLKGYISKDAPIVLSLYNASGKKLYSKTISGKLDSASTASLTSNSKLKGNYYVKVSKSSTKASAAYSIKYTNPN